MHSRGMKTGGLGRSILLSTFFLVFGFSVNMLAIAYATMSVSNPVSDIVLSNIPVIDVDGMFVYGTFLLTAFCAFVIFSRKSRIPFCLYALGLFWIIRAGFTSLTHIAPFPVPPSADFGTFITRFLLSGGDLFFSGHTGTPFLFALIFWHNKALRALFMLWSVFFATIVLLAHLHYSIDVAAAFFITYAIFHVATQLFPRSWQLLQSEIV